MELDLLREINDDQLVHTGPDPGLEGRIQAFELAFGMQSAAPEMQDVDSEPPARTSSTGSTIRGPRISAASV